MAERERDESAVVLRGDEVVTKSDQIPIDVLRNCCEAPLTATCPRTLAFAGEF